MEMKKSDKAQLGRKRGQFLIIGVIVALSVTISAFEWKSYGDFGTVPDSLIVIEDPVWEPVVTKQEFIKPPKPKLIAPIIIETNDDDLAKMDDIEIEFEFNLDDLDLEIAPSFPVEDEPDFVLFPEIRPEFEGGQNAFMNYIAKNIKYPPSARRMGIEGKVFVEFIIDKEGKLIEVKAIKGIGAGCDEEAVRVLKEAPAWKPGKQRGKPVKVKMVLPIYFQLG